MKRVLFIILMSYSVLSGCVYARFQPTSGGGTDNGNTTQINPVAALPQNQQVWTTSISAMSVSSASGRLTGTLSINPNSVGQTIQRPRYQLSDPVLEARRLNFEAQAAGESP